MFNGFDTEEEYLRSLKKEDHYYYSFTFEYIVTNYGNDEYVIAEATMEVDVYWDDTDLGYKCNYSCAEEDLIDPNEGNGSLDEFFEQDIYFKVVEALENEGVSSDAISL